MLCMRFKSSPSVTFWRWKNWLKTQNRLKNPCKKISTTPMVTVTDTVTVTITDNSFTWRAQRSSSTHRNALAVSQSLVTVMITPLRWFLKMPSVPQSWHHCGVTVGARRGKGVGFSVTRVYYEINYPWPWPWPWPWLASPAYIHAYIMSLVVTWKRRRLCHCWLASLRLWMIY